MDSRQSSPGRSISPTSGSSRDTQVADGSIRNFEKHRQSGDTAITGMLAEVERVMAMIRDSQQANDALADQNKRQANDNEDLKKKLEMIKENVRVILNAFPSHFVPPSTEKDDLTRLERAVASVIERLKKATNGLTKAKQNVNCANDEVKRVRDDVEKLQRVLDEATYRLRELIKDKQGTPSIIALIKASRNLLEDGRKATADAKKKFVAEKEATDELLEERRHLLGALKNLYEQCGKVDRSMNEAGLKPTRKCPENLDEKRQMAAEFERALSWLIDRIRLLLEGVRSSKRRLFETEEQLKKLQANVQKISEDMTKCEDSIRNAASRLEELKKQLDKESDRSKQLERIARDIQKEHENAVEAVKTSHENERSKWQEMGSQYETECKKIREEMTSLTKQLADGRNELNQLSDRVERTLKEYSTLKEKLDEDKGGWQDENRNREMRIRQLMTEIAAAEAKTKEAEREAQEYEYEIREFKEILDRDSQWRDGDQTRFNVAQEQRMKDELELRRLENEGKTLSEKVKASERSLNNRDARIRELQESVDELETKVARLEKESEELRYQSDGEGRLVRPKATGSCSSCSENSQAAKALSALRRERETLANETAKLSSELKEVSDRKQRLMDEAVRKTLGVPESESLTSTLSSAVQRRSRSRSRSRSESQSEQSEDEDQKKVSHRGPRHMSSGYASSEVLVEMVADVQLDSASPNASGCSNEEI